LGEEKEHRQKWIPKSLGVEKISVNLEMSRSVLAKKRSNGKKGICSPRLIAEERREGGVSNKTLNLLSWESSGVVAEMVNRRKNKGHNGKRAHSEVVGRGNL